MKKPFSFKPGEKQEAQISRELLVFAWNLRSLATPFEQQSLALNTIEHGRAWHWRLLPAGWAESAFILRHGQLKTKRAFARFFPSLNRTEFRHSKQPMRIKKPRAGEAPLAWETVKAVFAQNPILKKAGVLAGAQALLNEHQFTDLIDAKISALSTRGFARDFVDLYAAHKQKQLNWRSLLTNASKNQLNDYNPVELENNLKLIEQEFQKGTQDIPCSHPPQLSDLSVFLEELRSVNAEIARELTRLDGGLGNDEIE